MCCTYCTALYGTVVRRTASLVWLAARRPRPAAETRRFCLAGHRPGRGETRQRQRQPARPAAVSSSRDKEPQRTADAGRACLPGGGTNELGAVVFSNSALDGPPTRSPAAAAAAPCAPPRPACPPGLALPGLAAVPPLVCCAALRCDALRCAVVQGARCRSPQPAARTAARTAARSDLSSAFWRPPGLCSLLLLAARAAHAACLPYGPQPSAVPSPPPPTAQRALVARRSSPAARRAGRRPRPYARRRGLPLACCLGPSVWPSSAPPSPSARRPAPCAPATP